MKRAPTLHRIGAVARAVGVDVTVLRYWETEFRVELQLARSTKGQRLYSERQVETLGGIRRLLHIEGYTVAGARRALRIKRAVNGPQQEPQPV